MKKNKKQCSLLVFDRTCTLFCGFIFLRAQTERASKFGRKKLGSIERNLSSPYMKIPYKQKVFVIRSFCNICDFQLFKKKKKKKKKKKSKRQNHGFFYAFYNCLLWKMWALTHLEGQIMVEIQIITTFIKWNKNCNSKDVIKSWSFLVFLRKV